MNNPLTHRGSKHFQSSYDRDRRGTVLSVNHDPGKLPTYFGYGILTFGFVVIWIKDLVERRLDHMRREEPHVFQRERADGKVLELRQVHLPGGGFVTSFSDITVHKQVESALRESERAVRAYTDVVPVLIAFVDRERRFRFVNLAYEHYLGRAREQIIGRRVDEVLSTEHFAARKARIDAALATAGAGDDPKAS